MDCFVARAPRNDEESGRTFAFPRRGAPEVCKKSPPKEGAGNAGRPVHPQPRVQSRKHTSVVTTSSPGLPGIPARNGFNGFLRALPGDRLVVTVIGGLRFCRARSGFQNLRQLDASAGASGPHDFAVRESISRLCAA